jgi:hypothetical protein
LRYPNAQPGATLIQYRPGFSFALALGVSSFALRIVRAIGFLSVQCVAAEGGNGDYPQIFHKDVVGRP